MKIRHIPIFLTLLFATPMLTACGLVAFAAYVTVGAAALVGYGAYKTGEAGLEVAGEAGEFAGERISLRAGQVGDATSSVASGIAGIIFIGGDFKATYPTDVEQAWHAARSASQEMRLISIEGDYDAISGEITAFTNFGSKVSIKLQARSDSTTEVRIRVGLRGDKDASQLIHDRIVQRLEKTDTLSL